MTPKLGCKKVQVPTSKEKRTSQLQQEQLAQVTLKQFKVIKLLYLWLAKDMGNCFSSPSRRRSKGKHPSTKKMPRSRRHKTRPWNPERRGQTYIRKKHLTVNSPDYELQAVRPSTRRRKTRSYPEGGGQGGYVYQGAYPQDYEGPFEAGGTSRSSSSTTVRDITDNNNRPAGGSGGGDNAGEGPSMSGAAAP